MWLERLSKLFEHRQAKYEVPAKLKKGFGGDIYTVKVGGHLFQHRHHSQMKRHVSDRSG